MAALSQVPSKERGGAEDLLATCHLFISDILAFSKLLLHLPHPLIMNIPGALQQGSELNIELSFQNCGEDYIGNNMKCLELDSFIQAPFQERWA